MCFLLLISYCSLRSQQLKLQTKPGKNGQVLEKWPDIIYNGDTQKEKITLIYKKEKKDAWIYAGEEARPVRAGLCSF